MNFRAHLTPALFLHKLDLAKTEALDHRLCLVLRASQRFLVLRVFVRCKLCKTERA